MRVVHSLSGREIRSGALVLAVVAATVMPASAELDHLLGIRVRDPAGPSGSSYIVNSASSVGLRDCKIIRPIYYLDPAERDADDDPRGGRVGGAFVCYKARCPLNAVAFDLDDHLSGTRAPVPTKVQMLCLPADTHLCGDGDIDPGEQCDRDDSGSCGNGCSETCTCLP